MSPETAWFGAVCFVAGGSVGSALAVLLFLRLQR